MIAEFCGNPFNHEPHSEDGLYCAGVERTVVEEKIVEKYDPRTQAADGTSYSKVTIIIEHPVQPTIIIESERSSHVMFEVDTEKYVALEYATRDFVPEINRAEFSFTPNKDAETGIAFTVKRVDKNGETNA